VLAKDEVIGIDGSIGVVMKYYWWLFGNDGNGVAIAGVGLAVVAVLFSVVAVFISIVSIAD